MHSDYFEALQALAKCTFQCGSYDKRFVNNLSSLGPYDMLTVRQEQNIERLTFRYRKQLGRLKYGAPIAFIEAVAERARATQAERMREVKYHWVPEQRPGPTKENPQLTLLEHAA